MLSVFNKLICSSPRRLALPIAVYPGLSLTGARVCDVVSNAAAQAETQVALQQRYHSPFVLSAMDLSAEAEAFGCELLSSEHEVPTVTGRLVTSLAEAQKLVVPSPGDKRTSVHLEAVRILSRLPDKPMVLAGCIGPFSLAARLVGVSEAMELTVTEPGLVHTLLEKCAGFLIEYIRAFQSAGASGIIMAEPAAGLLSPRSLTQYSSAYLRVIHRARLDESFAYILHNCAAKVLHLPAILDSGLGCFHFGAPMDMVAALGKVPPDVILCGNLDPSAVFCQSSPETVRAKTIDLITATSDYRNFVLSSGCDIPPNAPLASLDAFYSVLD